MFYLNAVSSFSQVCSVVVLRSINGVLTILCSVLIYEIITNLRPTLDERKATIYAVVLSMYPLHWFFSFLYYTDVASLTAVLAMYLVCLKKNYWFSGLVMDHINYLLWVFKNTNFQGALLNLFLSFFFLVKQHSYHMMDMWFSPPISSLLYAMLTSCTYIILK